MPNSNEKIIRYALGILLLVIALNAFAGGYYGIGGAKDVPVEWLEGSPFTNYVIPSIILFVVVGGSALVASIFVFQKRKIARKSAFTVGAIILIWIAMQISIIGYVSWMQLATTIAAILILLLTWLMPKKFKINIGE